MVPCRRSETEGSRPGHPIVVAFALVGLEVTLFLLAAAFLY